MAAALVLDRRDHEVTVLTSGETRDAAERLGFEVRATGAVPIRIPASPSRRRRI
jgi:UDP:flavonoid glycosyltransferase YjiC (YdhE family)